MSKVIVKKTTNLLRKVKLEIANYKISSPLFLPDATRGYLKNIQNTELLKSKTNVLMVNTYHLYLRPGLSTILKHKGLHNFMSWLGPLMSDSGGFQVFSLVYNNKKNGKISDKEVIFKSPIDGSIHNLSPEKSIQIQFELATNIMVCLDDCLPHNFSKKDHEKSVERTIKWAKRSKIEYEKQLKKRKIKEKNRPLLLAVIQGGLNIDLRRQCANALIEIGFDAYGFGARPVDNEGNFLTKIISETANMIPDNAWRFALGFGTPEDIYKSYLLGWDAFDCVIPSREGRHGRLFYYNNNFSALSLNTKNFYQTINILNSKYKNDKSKINEKSVFKDLNLYSKSFLHHLFKNNDPLGQRLATLNNIEFYQKLMNYLKLLK